MIEPVRTHLGDWLVDEFRKSDLKWAEIVKKVGVADATLRRVILGYRIPAVNTLVKIGESFKLDQNEMWRRYELVMKAVASHGGVDAYPELEKDGRYDFGTVVARLYGNRRTAGNTDNK
jgi:cyanate lyase